MFLSLKFGALLAGLVISGADASMFSASAVGGLPRSIAPGSSMSMKITFSAPRVTFCTQTNSGVPGCAAAEILAIACHIKCSHQHTLT